jgi:threonine synthase
MLDALRSSKGTALAVDDEEIRSAITLAGRLEGLFLCPEGAACLPALQRLTAAGWVRRHEHIVVFNTATGLKYDT